MASGKQHQDSNKKLINGLLIINSVALFTSIIYFTPVTILTAMKYYIAALAGMLFAYLFGPDLDHHVVTINETETALKIYYYLRKQGMKYKYANFIKQSIINITIWFWWLYSKIPHRSRLSHSYFLSTIIRELYFFTFLFGPIMFLFWTISPLVFIWNNITLFIVFFIYNCIIDANHIRMDK
jgi:uncharacterized metal-binding protein